ncbi:MAG: hypothetical protein HRT90_02035 [Candidatus Margulisbacteria bacterium]|nr:hypothetical protein [Candidatus Margulisiibacteriota bacterium]
MLIKTTKKKLYIVLGALLVSVLLGGFGWYGFADSCPDSTYTYTATPTNKSACQEANEAMVDIMKNPLSNTQTFTAYALIYSDKFIDKYNYSGPDYFFIIKNKSLKGLISGRLDKYSEINIPHIKYSLAKCTDEIIKKEAPKLWSNRTTFTKSGFSIDRCLIFISEDLEGKYPVYLESSNCFITKYNGNTNKFLRFEK